MLEELAKYRAEFEEIVDTVYKAYSKQPLISAKKYLVVLYDSISSLEATFPLDAEDIRQELVFRWLIFISKYYEAKPNVKLRQYLIRRSIWAMRDWFHLLMKKPVWDTPVIVFPEFNSFVLNFKFLIHGTDVAPFDILSPYERYLIFLKFKEERTILEIAKAVQKTRKTVKAQLKSIYDKLRSHSDASTNTGRSSSRIDGVPT